MISSYKNLLAALLIVLLSASCSSRWQIVQTTASKIAVDSSCDSLADRDYEAYLLPYKQAIDDKLNTVIGHSAVTMSAARPESLLSNFSADIMRESLRNNFDSVVDIAIVNIGGLRSTIPQGPVTLKNIFELMPFENELVVLWIRGDILMKIFDIIARLGGEGLSGARMGIDEGKAVKVEINGKAIRPEALYSVATNDFLAGGNDKLAPLTKHEKRWDTGLKIRDVYANFIRKQTKEGKNIDAQLDRRIYYVEK